MNLGAFTVAAVVAKQANMGGERGGETIPDYAGLGRRAAARLAMAACLVSLIGLPPLAGFNAKLNVMVLLGSGGGWWWLLVAAIGINTVLSMYFYLRIVKTMYFNDSERAMPRMNAPGLAMAGSCAVVLVVLFIAFGPVSRLTGAYGRMLGDTDLQHTKAAAEAIASGRETGMSWHDRTAQ